MLRNLWVVALVAATAGAQKYDGPPPAKADLPYLKQASALIPTESAESRGEQTKNGMLVIDGAESRVKTPLSLPIFYLKADKLAPQRLQLYKLEVKAGHRELATGGQAADVLHMEVTKLNGGLYQIAVSDPLEAGEYVLKAEGFPEVFCFQVF